MLQGATLTFFNPLVLTLAHTSECQNLQFCLQIKPVNVSYSQFLDFYFFAPSAPMG